MRGEPTTFWGKLERDDAQAVVAWHPLAAHCLDVAAVGEALLSLPTWQARLGRIAGHPLDEITRQRLSVLIALHDVGKFNLGFQAKGRPTLGVARGHVTEGLGVVFCGPPALRKALGLDRIGQWGEAAGDLLAASIAHHGRPESVDAAPYQDAWWREQQGLNPEHGLASLLAALQAAYPEAFGKGPDLPSRPEFGHAFAGLVMLADWLGSDTRFFPYAEDHRDRLPFAQQRARMALSAVGLEVTTTRTATPLSDPFTAVSPFPPRPAQQAVVDLPIPKAGGSITVLEAETGSGKTEAALARFIDLFRHGLVDGLYFALPTRTAATQIQSRVTEAVARAFPEAALRPPVVLAVPGYLRVDDASGQRLPGFEVQWPDRPGERFRHRAWAAESAKRFLVGTIAVGTIDQVLLSALMVPHAHLRSTALLRHLLVVDEVHASDAYMSAVLEEVLRIHHSAGGHALLLSATLGAAARQRLQGESSVPDLATARAVPYPLVSHRDDVVRAYPVAGGARREVRIEQSATIDDADAIARRAAAAVERGAKVLILRNTVADAVATQAAVEGLLGLDSPALLNVGGVAAPHHARFARPDRESLDAAIERGLGKARGPGPFVAVATQTVQQSLDVDADLLITDLCPIDVLLQRMGRLHRHLRADRPPGFEHAVACVLTPAERDLSLGIASDGTARARHGLGGVVYEDLRVIEATWRLVERGGVWTIPDDCRALVEEGVHPDVLSVTERINAAWVAHGVRVRGQTAARGRIAELNLIDRTRPYADTAFPASTDRRVSTRLGLGDRRVGFEPPARGPFGNALRELTLPAWMAHGIAPDADRAEVTSARPDAVAFRVGDKPFLYDRFGLRPHTESAPSEADDA